MRDYITTIFNLIVGLIDADKIVLLALIGLGVIVVWQLLSLLTSFHRRFAGRCRKISKFLTKKGLSANNYNNFLALIAKMPQEFIRGYKTFEHASYGLPSDYIKRFESIDVELNGGVLNHGKSLVKAVIYGWTIILFILSLALLGSEATLTGFALADALVVPVLFLILAKIVYFIFNAIKQQQYKMAVDEFNEMLDIMNDKIENNDNLPGPDVLADLIDSVPTAPASEPEKLTQEDVVNEQPTPVVLDEVTDEDFNDEQPTVEPISTEELNQYKTENEIDEEALVENDDAKENSDEQPEIEEEVVSDEEPVENFDEELATEEKIEQSENSETYTEEELVDQIEEPTEEENEDVLKEDEIFTEEDIVDSETSEEPEEVEEFSQVAQTLVEQPVETENEKEVEIPVLNQEDKKEEPLKERTTETKEQTKKEEVMEEQKRGRGRPRKVDDGELVITNDKQFEEVLQRAEKLMRKSEEALSASQAKRVEKSLKELVDAMTKYKEEH